GFCPCVIFVSMYDISNHPSPMQRVVNYRNVAGAFKDESGTVGLYEVRRWAKENMRPAKSQT
ncbi:hypothetical protein, partial [Litorivivens sp.]|uniref:hypothetical protein n=1 Tax=Litorivivens sp. TaxID=2020868 RepID=UPI0035680F72